MNQLLYWILFKENYKVEILRCSFLKHDDTELSEVTPNNNNNNNNKMENVKTSNNVLSIIQNLVIQTLIYIISTCC